MQLQAFFALSFEQFESNDVSFEQMHEEGEGAATAVADGAARRPFAAAATALKAALAGGEQQQPAGAGGGGDGEGEVAGSGRCGGGLGGLLGMLRRRVTAAGKVAQRHAVAAVGARGKGLSVDLDMRPSLPNIIRLLFFAPVHPNSMFKVGRSMSPFPTGTTEKSSVVITSMRSRVRGQDIQ